MAGYVFGIFRGIQVGFVSSSRSFFIWRAKVVADLAGLLMALLFATQVAGFQQTGLSLSELLSMRISLANLIGSALLAWLWVMVLKSRNLYRPDPAIRTSLHELREIAISAALVTVIYAAMAIFLVIRLFTPTFFLVFALSVVALTWGFRQLMVLLIQQFHLGDQNARNVVLVGTNQAAVEYARNIEGGTDAPYNVLGFMDDAIVCEESRSRYLCHLDQFGELLDRHVIDELVIAMPIHSCTDAIRDVLDQAHERGIAVRFPMSQIFSGMTTSEVWRTRQEATLGSNGRFQNDLVVYSGHEFGLRYLIKRGVDILMASTLLVLTSPLMLIAVLGTYMTSGRPALFVQQRYGYHGRIFNLYKFRTMVKNADALQEQLRAQNERDGAAFKMKNDPRVTRFGHFLRKTSIDELPQLINVLKGEMSMVGPRPLPLADYKRMNKSSHRRRLSVLPGITGPWQISGRDQISFEEWMQMDLDYIDNWRLSTDLRIILMTVPTVLLARGSK